MDERIHKWLYDNIWSILTNHLPKLKDEVDKLIYK